MSDVLPGSGTCNFPAPEFTRSTADRAHKLAQIDRDEHGVARHFRAHHITYWAHTAKLEVVPPDAGGLGVFTPMLVLAKRFEEDAFNGVLVEYDHNAPRCVHPKDFERLFSSIMESSFQAGSVHPDRVIVPTGPHAGKRLRGYRCLVAHGLPGATHVVRLPRTPKPAKRQEPPAKFLVSRESYNVPMFQAWLAEQGYEPSTSARLWAPNPTLWENFIHWTQDATSDAADYWLSRRRFEQGRAYPRDAVYRDPIEGPRRIAKMVRRVFPTCFAVKRRCPVIDRYVPGVAGLRGPGYHVAPHLESRYAAKIATSPILRAQYEKSEVSNKGSGPRTSEPVVSTLDSTRNQGKLGCSYRGVQTNR